jgi:glycyl-tRNA synthetase (class II)
MREMCIRDFYFPFFSLQFLALSPLVAPIKCSVLPLSRDAKLDVVVNEVISAFEQRHIAYKLVRKNFV